MSMEELKQKALVDIAKAMGRPVETADSKATEASADVDGPVETADSKATEGTGSAEAGAKSTAGADDKKTEEDIKKASMVIEHATAFADYPLKSLIAHTLGKSIHHLFGDVDSKVGHIKITQELDGKTKHKKMSLQIKPKDYMLDLGELKDAPKAKECMTFLLNSVRVLFPALRDHLRKSMEFNYVLQISLNTMLFFDKDSPKRIGIVLEDDDIVLEDDDITDL